MSRWIVVLLLILLMGVVGRMDYEVQEQLNNVHKEQTR